MLLAVRPTRATAGRPAQRAFANQSFDYDLNGNRLSNGSNAYTYVANSNRMDTRKGITLGRDATGNHTSNGLGQTYAWDGHGHLSQFSLNGVQKATYFYNYDLARLFRTMIQAAFRCSCSN
ncbi:MAG: hypothetical protein HZT40_19755 [Candidatus Thiothrix singaporensis]|uniref:RHS repeat-associated core domain-containing protein n=1 Tax=Candidatus Thiothrix singaporensis TaxID=2799669 RepID=A0A7L6AW87_9GAMM|nr:MAG: hypothetical protein HZT40_19755 [Candidatus Thiothrix singaporensis]